MTLRQDPASSTFLGNLPVVRQNSSETGIGFFYKQNKLSLAGMWLHANVVSLSLSLEALANSLQASSCWWINGGLWLDSFALLVVIHACMHARMMTRMKKNSWRRGFLSVTSLPWQLFFLLQESFQYFLFKVLSETFSAPCITFIIIFINWILFLIFSYWVSL